MIAMVPFRNTHLYDNPLEAEPEILLMEEVEEQPEKAVILYNDDVNTFDFVIDCLIEICKHEPEQAEQCSIIVHYKGKCDVKHGTYEKLVPICSALLDRGLTAEIE